MKEIHLIDTNILVYAFDNSEKKKHRTAVDLLKKCFDEKEKFAISSQNLAEFFIVMSSKVKSTVNKKEIQDIVENIIEFEGFYKINYDEHTVLQAIDIHRKYNVDFWDALIASTMLNNGINYIYTENIKDFRKIPNITSLNPFI